MTVLVGVCATLLVLYFCALQLGWFSRIERGFLVTIIAAIAGFAMLSAAVAGVLAYRAGRQIIREEIVAGLSNAGDIVEANLRETIALQTGLIHRYAESVAPELAAGRRQAVEEKIAHIDDLTK